MTDHQKNPYIRPKVPSHSQIQYIDNTAWFSLEAAVISRCDESVLFLENHTNTFVAFPEMSLDTTPGYKM